MAGAESLAGVAVLVTAGPTREAIDPVRYLSNRSSGKMGFAVARAAVEAGAEVTLVSGPVSLTEPDGLLRVDVESAAEMQAAVRRYVSATGIFVGAAAVADYAPVPALHKIKKTAPTLSLELHRTPDIIAAVAALAERPFTVGFAAETDKVVEHARDKLERKGLDMIAANRVGEGLGFGSEVNALTVLWRGGRQELPTAGKLRLARQLVALIAEHYGYAAARRNS